MISLRPASWDMFEFLHFDVELLLSFSFETAY